MNSQAQGIGHDPFLFAVECNLNSLRYAVKCNEVSKTWILKLYRVFQARRQTIDSVKIANPQQHKQNQQPKGREEKSLVLLTLNTHFILSISADVADGSGNKGGGIDYC